MYVYVINVNNQPLMPTKRFTKVRKLLKTGQAKVVNYSPFTIKLLYETTNNIQNITLGIDAGSKTVGVSATTKTKELYSGEFELRNDVVGLLSDRRQYRRSRRNRKTRYRKSRFLNRTKSKKEGWLAPSIKTKIDEHLRIVKTMHKMLPISKIIIETAQFDIQKIKNPDIQGVEYQQGEQLDFWNVREYVLHRDNHVCQCCKGKSKDSILNVHHIESRKIGGDAPNNLITLCETCHQNYHKGLIELPKTIKRGMKFNDASFMGVMRWAFYNELKEIYPNVSYTYGYITKNIRIENNLPKEHRIDAMCISGNIVESLDVYYYNVFKRKHNRQIHKATISKGGKRKLNQTPYEVFGFRLFDLVKTNTNVIGYICGRRSSGYFDIRKLNGEKISAGINYKKIKLLKKRKTILTEKRCSSVSSRD